MRKSPANRTRPQRAVPPMKKDDSGLELPVSARLAPPPAPEAQQTLTAAVRVVFLLLLLSPIHSVNQLVI